LGHTEANELDNRAGQALDKSLVISARNTAGSIWRSIRPIGASEHQFGEAGDHFIPPPPASWRNLHMATMFSAEEILKNLCD
jgi:hypothetical protein